MLNIFMLAWKYRKYVGALFAVVSLLGALWGYGHVKYREGLSKGIHSCEIQKQEVINDNIQIKEMQDNVVRPSDSVLIERLLGGTF